MTNYPTVSFIIPTLNAGRFLERCLSAIRNQDYPAEKIEIIVADANSIDDTRKIAQQYKAKLIDNPLVLHEPGKTLATKEATGELIFYTDADNILAHPNWLKAMVKPYLKEKNILGLLPQTTAPPDSPSLNRYLGYLFTDPLTWFIYGPAANPHDYKQIYQPTIDTKDYKIYRFTAENHPLFGLSQGVGVARAFQRGGAGAADDILSGIQLIKHGGLVAYAPTATLYHYHVEGWADFIKKYRWRIRNNLTQQTKGMGMVNRLAYYNQARKIRRYLFPLYALTLIGPIFDSLRLAVKWRDPVMFWHLPASVSLAILILLEYSRYFLGLKVEPGAYGR